MSNKKEGKKLSQINKNIDFKSIHTNKIPETRIYESKEVRKRLRKTVGLTHYN